MKSGTAGEAVETAEKRARDGVLCAALAFTLWGVFPLYFAVVKSVPAYEVLVHRIIWAVPFGALIIHLRHQWREVLEALKSPRTMGYLVASAVLITGNWLVYIWAVQLEQINQASLGYYLNPLLFTLAGVVIFGERLRPAQLVAVSLAAVAVAILTIRVGELPAITLFLGVTFAAYGVIRKQVDVAGMPGLFIETILVLPFALGYLSWLMATGAASFSIANLPLSAILLMAGPLTVLPLLFFGIAARRLNLATIGMMQFIAPTLQFVVAVFFGEELTTAHIICFSLIWIAVALFSVDAWRMSRATAAIAAR